MPLTPDQIARYARHLSLPGVGRSGQLKLLKARVAIVGAGGLGSAAGFYLAAAGIGHLGIIDGDKVEVSNLQRQILHRTADIGRAKVKSATARLKALNPGIAIHAIGSRLTAANAGQLLAGYDFVIDATDNFTARFDLARACHAMGTPYVYGGIQQFTGQVMTIIPGKSTCLRCLFESIPEDDGRNIPRGPLGVLPGVIGTLQATEALKFVLGIGALLTNRLLLFDALGMNFRHIAVNRTPQCPLCAKTRQASR